MKIKTVLALAGLGGPMILSASASAAFVGLSVATVASGSGQGGPINPPTIYHVYANFTAATDRVNVWGIGGDLGQGAIANILETGLPGSGFHNVGGAVNAAPYSPGSNRDWDSYATLGLRYGMDGPGNTDAAMYSPGFPNLATGTLLVPNPGPPGNGQMAVFVTPDDAQGAAGYINNGSDTELRVLLMQLVVDNHEHIAGTIGLVIDTTPLAGGGEVISGATFTSVPAPGALSALALAALAGSRRRRA